MSIKIDDLAKEVMRGLDEYADVTTEQVKKAVRKAGNTVRREIQENAPKNTGDYAKSWAVKRCVNLRTRSKWWCIPRTAIS